MINNSTYKQTSIGLIPNDWEVERFDNVFQLFTTNSFSRDNLTYDKTKNEIQNIHYGDIHSKFKDEILDCSIEQLPFIKDDFILNQKFNYLKDGDLIIADASEDYEGVGECIEVKNIGTKKIVSGLHTFLARDNSDKTAQGYRTYIFNNPKVAVELKKIATGTSVFSISKSELQKLKIPLPPLPEQQKIASILSTWDTAIDNCKNIIEKVSDRNKGLAQQLLTGKMRVKGFEEKWKNMKLSDFSINRNSSLSINYLEGNIGEFPLYGANRIIQRIDFFESEEPYISIIKDGAGVGRTFLCEGKSSVVGTMAYIKSNEKSTLNFLFHLLKLIKFESFITGSTIPHIYFSSYGKKHFDIPNVEEQKAIVNILDTATQELNQYQQKLETLQLQKKGLMQQLLTGKTRVKI